MVTYAPQKRDETYKRQIKDKMPSIDSKVINQTDNLLKHPHCDYTVSNAFNNITWENQ